MFLSRIQGFCHSVCFLFWQILCVGECNDVLVSSESAGGRNLLQMKKRNFFLPPYACIQRLKALKIEFLCYFIY